MEKNKNTYISKYVTLPIFLISITLIRLSVIKNVTSVLFYIVFKQNQVVTFFQSNITNYLVVFLLLIPETYGLELKCSYFTLLSFGYGVHSLLTRDSLSHMVSSSFTSGTTQSNN